MKAKIQLRTALSLFVIFPTVKSFSQTVEAGYTISVFTNALPSPYYKITCDKANKIFYLTKGTEGDLYKLDYSGSGACIKNGWASAAGAWHPYLATQLKFFNNALYSFSPYEQSSPVGQKFITVDPVSGVSSSMAAFSSTPGIENGIAKVNDTLFGVNGNTYPCEVFYYDLKSHRSGSLFSTGVGLNNTNMAYSSATNKLYVSSSTDGLYVIDRTSHKITRLASYAGAHVYDIEIDPAGTYAYLAGASTILKLNLATGALTSFVSGLNSALGVAVGPATKGSGYSLFIIDESSLYEVQGFPLPSVPSEIKGFSFDAVYINGKGILNWKTASERDAEKFIAEKSTDGTAWTAIQTIEAKGNSTTGSNYSYIDAQLTEQVYYYRIKQIDIYRAFTYSAIKKIEIPRQRRIFWYLNPVGSLVARVYSAKTEQYALVDMNGRICRQGTLSNGVLSLNYLAAGTYMIRINTSPVALTEKIIIK